VPEPLAILFEDAHCLAVAKPAGVLSQGDPGSVEAAARLYLRPDDPASAYVGLVHRLDRPVSGVLLLAKTPKAARRLADQFARRAARKEYWAIVAGGPTTDEGAWDDWLWQDDSGGRGLVQVVRAGTPRARRALTRFRREPAPGLGEGLSWLRLWPETGRTHQLRAQATARGWPIVGDRAYGSAVAFGAGIALHARSLVVEHPLRHEPLTIEAPLPDSWRAVGLKPG
jgi:23S rRNA pseudouridine1911/1915/1917 synthase